MWFKKKDVPEILNHEQVHEILKTVVREIDKLSFDEKKELLLNGKQLPEIIKIKLYDFLIEYNSLDAVLEQSFRKENQIQRFISSNIKEKDCTLNSLVKNNQIRKLLENLSVYQDEEIDKSIIIIIGSIELRDRVAHAVPIWCPNSKVILFHSYDGVFWNKTYKKLRQEQNQYHDDDYLSKMLNEKTLHNSQFSYVPYHLYEINFLTQKIKEIRLSVADKVDPHNYFISN